MHRSILAPLAALAFCFGSSAAHASYVAVTVYETLAGVKTQVASWEQDQNPVPDAYVNNYYTTVPVFSADGLSGDTDVTWYSTSGGELGGFTNYSEDFNVLAPASYASLESSPTFLPGVYYGVNVKPDLTYVLAEYSIAVVSQPQPLLRTAFTPFIASVPEPGSWAMMLAGFGMIGFVARRRRSGYGLRKTM